MFSKYEIYCGNQIVKFKQQIDQGNTIGFNPDSLPKNQKILKSSYAEDRLSDSQTGMASTSDPVGGDGAGDSGPPGYGAPTTGVAPVTVIGPFISVCPCCDCVKAEHPKIEQNRTSEEADNAGHL